MLWTIYIPKNILYIQSPAKIRYDRAINRGTIYDIYFNEEFSRKYNAFYEAVCNGINLKLITNEDGRLNITAEEATRFIIASDAELVPVVSLFNCTR